MATQDFTAATLRGLLTYDALTGEFRWRSSPNRKVAAGAVAGKTTPQGYRQIKVNGKGYSAHRLAWLFAYGKWPDGVIDHIDGNRANNALANLRDTTCSVNAQNRRNTSSRGRAGLLGVSWNETRQHWMASIRVGNVVKNLGKFDAPEPAHQAYLEAKRQLHAGCTI